MSIIIYVGRVERGTFVNSETGKEQSRLATVGSGTGHAKGLNFYPDFDIKAGEKVIIFVQDNNQSAPAVPAATS